MSEEGDKSQNLEGLACALKQEVETLYLKLDNSKKENIALKENNSENNFKLGALKVKTEKQHNMSDLLKKEVQLGKEENKKLRALCNKNVDDLVKMNKELTVLAN